MYEDRSLHRWKSFTCRGFLSFYGHTAACQRTVKIITSYFGWSGRILAAPVLQGCWWRHRGVFDEVQPRGQIKRTSSFEWTCLCKVDKRRGISADKIWHLRQKSWQGVWGGSMEKEMFRYNRPIHRRLHDKRTFSRHRGLGGSGWSVTKTGKTSSEVHSASETTEVVSLRKVDLPEVKHARVCWHPRKTFEGHQTGGTREKARSEDAHRHIHWKATTSSKLWDREHFEGGVWSRYST